MTSSFADDRLAPSPLPPDVVVALARVAPRFGRLPSRLLYFHSVDSTNALADRLATAGAEEGLTIVADEQTAGRGRQGRVWWSPAGAGLYLSIVLRPEPPRNPPSPVTSLRLALLTIAAGVGVAEGVRASTGLPVEIKWPNDLLIGRRKLGGILAEASLLPPSASYVVLGVGLNLRAAAYPVEISPHATSLEAELGRGVDRGTVLAEVLAALGTRYGDLVTGRFDAILSAWRQLAPSSRGAHVELDGPAGPCHGTTEGIDDHGALLVRVGPTVHRAVAGAVKWL